MILSKLLRQLKKRYALGQIRRYGFWFVDIPRTSSTSIRAELGRHYGIPFGKANTDDKRFSTPQLFKTHLRAIDMRQLVGPQLWEQLFTFTLVRNPWERWVSFYHWRQKAGTLPADIPFEMFIIALKQAQQHPHKLFSYAPSQAPIADYILDEEGQLIVDYIGHYEKRGAAMQVIGQRIGHPTLGQIHTQRTSSHKRPYITHYNAETRSIIADLEQWAINYFGYQFEPSTTNRT